MEQLAAANSWELDNLVPYLDQPEATFSFNHAAVHYKIYY